jgi:hypothetical protein
MAFGGYATNFTWTRISRSPFASVGRPRLVIGLKMVDTGSPGTRVAALHSSNFGTVKEIQIHRKMMPVDGG